MAFSKGNESAQGSASFKRFVGIGSVKVVAVNPTMKEWNEVTGGNMQKEIEYVGTTQDGTKTARVVLLVQPDKSKTIGEIEDVIPVTFWFRKLPIQGSQSGKYKIIDKYGRTAWATKEEIEAKKIPQYSNGPANIDADYRRAISGEEEFTDFLKAHLNIPALSYRDKSGNVVMNPNPSECEARLDNIMKIFDGDFTEIKTILNYQKDNYSKMLFGVRNNDGREYQDVFMGAFLTNGNNNHTRFAKALAESLEHRQTYTNTYFGDRNADGSLILTDLHEYVVTPSTIAPTNAEMPTVGTAQTDPTFNTNNDDLPF